MSSNYTAHKEITKINIDGCRTIIKIEKEPTYVEKLKICNMETLMDFLNMELVQEQLKSFMSERIYSKRHQMFSLDDERQNCNGKELSRLHRSSNPAYLTDMTGKICDVKAIEYLKENVVQKHKDLLSPSVRKRMNKEMEQDYVSLVLLPEALIYHLELTGMNRDDADKRFTDVHISDEEKLQLAKEIEECEVKSMDEAKEDLWIDYEE